MCLLIITFILREEIVHTSWDVNKIKGVDVNSHSPFSKETVRRPKRMAQHIKVPLAKPGKLVWIPETHVVEILQVFWPPNIGLGEHTHVHKCVCTHTHIYFKIEKDFCVTRMMDRKEGREEKKVISSCSFKKIFLNHLFLFYVYLWSACLCVRGCQMPWNWSYRQLWAAM